MINGQEFPQALITAAESAAFRAVTGVSTWTPDLEFPPGNEDGFDLQSLGGGRWRLKMLSSTDMRHTSESEFNMVSQLCSFVSKVFKRFVKVLPEPGQCIVGLCTAAILIHLSKAIPQL